MVRLGSCLPGVRVQKPDARPFDIAYGQVGTVHWDLLEGEVVVGVRWDGGFAIYQYPEDYFFEAVIPTSN